MSEKTSVIMVPVDTKNVVKITTVVVLTTSALAVVGELVKPSIRKLNSKLQSLAN
jgi:hypothetical protein